MTIPRISKTAAAATPNQAIRPWMTNGYEIDADYIVYRLEEAGATLLALPGTGWSTRMRSSSLEIFSTDGIFPCSTSLTIATATNGFVIDVI